MAKLGIIMTDEIERAVIEIMNEGNEQLSLLNVYSKLSESKYAIYLALWYYLEENACDVYDIISKVVHERSDD